MIFNLQRYSTHDGPGLRTVVFEAVRWAAAGVRTRKAAPARRILLYDARLCLERLLSCALRPRRK